MQQTQDHQSQAGDPVKDSEVCAGAIPAEQQSDPRCGGQQKEHRKQENHPPPMPLAPGGFQRAIPSPMDPDMGRDESGECQRKDGMHDSPQVPCVGAGGMSDGVKFESGPERSDEKRDQSPIDPIIACAFVHFNKIFQTLQSNRLSGIWAMDEPG